MFSVRFTITSAALALLGVTSAPDSSAAPATASALVSGFQHHCALTTTGGALCWGYNNSSQLGDATTINSNVPISVSGLGSGVTQLAGGQYHNCALLADSSARCWGSNSQGQLGNGSTGSGSGPVVGLSGAIAVGAGLNHSCALMATGGVKCWGGNANGQLGTGTTAASNTPVNVLNVTGAIGLAVGAYHSCALINSGQIQCWGNGTYGQLGRNSSANSSTRVDVVGIADASSIVAGLYHTCAKTNTGVAKCWGNNATGQLGNGTTANAWTPVAVSNLSGVTQLATSSASNSTCAILTGGGAKCWGYNNAGQLGTGDTINKTTPTTVSSLIGPVSIITIGLNSACARVSGGVQCWGANNYGQHGAGNNNATTTPQNVVGLFGAAPSQSPEPISPVTSNWPVYTWKAIPDASSYRLRINGVITAYTAAAVNCPDGVGLCTFRSGYLAPGVYSWQVQGVNDYGDGAWSALIQFLI